MAYAHSYSCVGRERLHLAFGYGSRVVGNITWIFQSKNVKLGTGGNDTVYENTNSGGRELEKIVQKIS